jgi:hypothetical protein
MRLKIVRFGESAEGIQLSGNPKSCEPDHVRIAFPGGDLEVVRAKDGKDPDYWVHIRINHPLDGMDVPGETLHGKLCDARLDIHGKDTRAADLGDMNHADLYHLAIRVKPNWKQ